MSPRYRSPVRFPSLRRPSGKDYWNQLSPYNLTLLQLEQTAGSSSQRGTGLPTEAGFSQGFFSILSPMGSFGSLPLSPLACFVGDTSFPAISSTWSHRYYLNWIELDDTITKFNNEIETENCVFILVILYYWHTIFLFWYYAVALIQFVLLKALYK